MIIIIRTVHIKAGLQLRVCNKKSFSYFSTKTCCRYSKELSQCDVAFEHLKVMLKLMGKKIFKNFVKLKEYLELPVSKKAIKLLTWSCEQQMRFWFVLQLN